MANRTWPALKSCKMQCLETQTRREDVNDPLNYLLPCDILMSILSILSMKEAARTSVLSHCWKNTWLHLPVLIFEAESCGLKDDHLLRDDPYAPDEHLLSQERSGFRRWVNSVVEAHLGPTIDELKLIIDVDSSCQSDIDKLVVFALTKLVKRLELNFTPIRGRKYSLSDCYTWPIESLGLHRNLSSLTSLCLKYVNVTTQDIDRVLRCCHGLENLCIVEGTTQLTEMKLADSPLRLKNLEVSCCDNMMCIDILAPKLVSFIYHGRPIKLHLRNTYLLSEVSIGYGGLHIYRGEIVTYANYYLWSYFPQLVYLSLDICLKPRNPDSTEMCNSGIDNPRTMKNLKHLELRVTARCDSSLLGWASLVEASPVLEKLTLKFPKVPWRQYFKYTRNIVKRKGRPLKSLKTIEHVGILGLPLENEFLTYVVENSTMLKQVIHLEPSVLYLREVKAYADKCVEEFKKTLPEGVNMEQRLYKNPKGGRDWLRL